MGEPVSFSPRCTDISLLPREHRSGFVRMCAVTGDTAVDDRPKAQVWQTAAEGLSDNTTDCACYATARASDTTILKPPFSNRYEAAVRKTITRLGRAGESNHSPCVERKWHPCKIEIAWGYRACPPQRLCPSATHTVPPLSMQVLRHPSHAARAEQPAAGVDRTRARRLQPVQDRPRRCQRLPPRPAVGPCSTGGLRVTTGRMCRRCLRR